MKTLSYMFIILGLFLSFSAAAQNSSLGAAAEFKVAARQIPEALLKAGYKRIGRMNLHNLLQNIQVLKVKDAKWVETKVGTDQKRVFARWERTAQGPKVTLNSSMWGKAFPRHHSPLALHEVLGAYGFNDDDYQLSTSLWLLAFEQKRQILSKEELKYLEKSIAERANISGGGVIGVGGGGDLIGPVLKISIIEAAYEDYDNSPTPANRAGVFRSFRVTEMFSVEGKWRRK